MDECDQHVTFTSPRWDYYSQVKNWVKNWAHISYAWSLTSRGESPSVLELSSGFDCWACFASLCFLYKRLQQKIVKFSWFCKETIGDNEITPIDSYCSFSNQQLPLAKFFVFVSKAQMMDYNFVVEAHSHILYWFQRNTSNNTNVQISNIDLQVWESVGKCLKLLWYVFAKGYLLEGQMYLQCPNNSNFATCLSTVAGQLTDNPNRGLVNSWTTKLQTGHLAKDNSRTTESRTGQLSDWTTRGQALDNSRTG